MSTTSLFHLSILVYSSFNIIFGLYSHFIKEKLFLSESLVSMLFGILIGPIGLNLIFPSAEDVDTDDIWNLFRQLARFVMTFQTMAAGISLPRAYFKRNWKDLLLLLGPVMLFMWITSSIIIFSVFNLFTNAQTFGLLESMALGACITPTDPILASSIVKGRFAEEHIPEHVRDLLSAERYVKTFTSKYEKFISLFSGANDGAAMPLLYLPLILMTSGPRSLFTKWVLSIWLKKIVLSIGFGVIFGLFANKMLKYSQYHDLIDKQSFIAFSLALSVNEKMGVFINIL